MEAPAWQFNVVASLVDIAGMKVRVIHVRGSWKHYVDIHTLVTHGIDVATGPAAAKAIDRRFDPITSIGALWFYGDGTLNRVPATMQDELTRWVQEVDLTNSNCRPLPCQGGLF